MDADLEMILWFVLTLALMATITAQMIHRRVIRHEERKLELEAQLEEAKAHRAASGDADYRRFEERLRVLERIATDGNHRLASQIEELRSLDAISDRKSDREKAL